MTAMAPITAGVPGRGTRTPGSRSPSPGAESAWGCAADSPPRARGPDVAAHDRAWPRARRPGAERFGGPAPRGEERRWGEARLSWGHGAVPRSGCGENTTIHKANALRPKTASNEEEEGARAGDPRPRARHGARQK